MEREGTINNNMDEEGSKQKKTSNIGSDDSDVSEPTRLGVVYYIINKLNGDVYIGSSLEVKKRFNKHKSQLKRGIHHSAILQRAWNKYGEDNFDFIIKDEVEFDLLIETEQKHIDDTKPKYNINQIAGDVPTRGKYGREHPRYKKEPWNKGLKGVQKGLKGNENPNYDKPAHNRKAVLQFDKDGNLIKEWDFLKQASRELSIHYGQLSACCNGKEKTAGGFKWEFK